MKKPVSIILAGAFILVSTGLLWASTVFTITAAVPAATGVSITPATVIENPTTHAVISYTPLTGTNLTFGTMTYDTTNKIWTAPNYFGIDIANIGAGSPNVTVAYAEGSKPVNQVNGLGYKATATFKKLVYVDATHNTESDYGTHAAKALKDVTSENITSAQTAGGWLRVYVGLSTGEAGKPGEPFTNADMSGTYTGTLTITATAS
ncbi:MAG: hypothetical protein WCO69_03605 [Candidatus Omnitrophota bacterium]